MRSPIAPSRALMASSVSLTSRPDAGFPLALLSFASQNQSPQYKPFESL
jgi:hypothetical protein